ncbi:MAG: hypothetical protein V3T58_00980 [Candidatus Hydrothermarchaeales archaeon]
MRSKSILLVLLVVGALLSGCVSKKPAAPTTTQPPITEAPEALEESFPDVTAPTEEIEITEPDFELNETVDLGSIL